MGVVGFFFFSSASCVVPAWRSRLARAPARFCASLLAVSLLFSEVNMFAFSTIAIFTECELVGRGVCLERLVQELGLREWSEARSMFENFVWSARLEGRDCSELKERLELSDD